MKSTRRLKRMARATKRQKVGLNLTSLMDVFTILVFFLLVNQSTVEVVEPPKEIKLPDSVVEAKPRQTVTIFVSADAVLVQGEPVVSIADVLAAKSENIAPIGDRLTALRDNIIGINTATVAKSNEVTILADRTIPFKVLKRLMSTCTSTGYTRISLAVNQKAHQG
ncbi:RNA polymerase subunit sigma-70 [Sulfurifustis variabilis]|uniref:RNA polymerase subunit sigma-70 n=1 Tax=Sulfurifustis variabilis TaxID=1675686 RepID=A0A1B4V4R8_9GAMM|nr:biopolymer transporter ExbD [Sulfurifustis variabilis]BAU48538.1 RNA polymerase subunit sigma-70 [Sulfurifustis variabilis]